MPDSSLMSWLRHKQIWIYSQAIDFRKQLNGLINVVIDELEKEPNDGSLYVFRNRQGNKLKLLLWDRNGYFMGYKRLEKGRFDFPANEEGVITITKDELYGLVSGMPMLWFSVSKKAIYHY